MREREERLRAAAAEERRHVARELHDVVAHAVSVMVIQAGAARQVVRTVAGAGRGVAARRRGDRSRGDGRAAAASWARSSDDDEAAGLAPQPGIGELGDAARPRPRGRAAGRARGRRRARGRSRASLDVTVYRIVQEALTNALRYARRAATLVRLTWEPDQLRLEILDDGPARGRGGDGSGRGLVGMRERASLVGGRLEAGPRLGGGYAVRAWLPLEPSAERSRAPARFRVLIADDQALVRAGFRMILEAQPDIEVVAEAADGEAAVRLARRHRPDVVLMDVRMPGLDGLEATRRLLAARRRPVAAAASRRGS